MCNWTTFLHQAVPNYFRVHSPYIPIWLSPHCLKRIPWSVLIHQAAFKCDIFRFIFQICSESITSWPLIFRYPKLLAVCFFYIWPVFVSLHACQLSSSWFHYHLLNHHPKETVWSEKRLRLWLFNEYIQWTFVNLHYISSTQSEISVNLDQTVCDKFHWRSGIFYHKSTQHVNLNRFDNIILSPVLLVGSFHNYIFSRFCLQA